jgi:hypothetical protein
MCSDRSLRMPLATCQICQLALATTRWISPDTYSRQSGTSPDGYPLGALVAVATGGAGVTMVIPPRADHPHREPNPPADPFRRRSYHYTEGAVMKTPLRQNCSYRSLHGQQRTLSGRLVGTARGWRDGHVIRSRDRPRRQCRRP